MGCAMKNYTDNEVREILYNNIDALLMVSSKDDTYRAITRSKEFAEIIAEKGSYKELIEIILFHINEGQAKISDEYQVFLPKMVEFKGKFAQKTNLEIGGVKHVVQLLVCPIDQEEGEYVLVLCDLDKSEFERDEITVNKVKTIQETYLFSMYVDLNKDLTSSINVTEISDDDLHYDIKYSEWRMMIVNMIWPEDQEMFLERTDPEYLRKHLKPAKTSAFDCQMKNLEGEYIWVKLIFGRTETTSELDFRFVFMVQNIHENSMQLITELEKFEKLASYDALTQVYNHGRIETELNNAIDALQKDEKKVSLMMFDIDYFKNINDTYGHAVGDEILKEFVQDIKNKLEKYDIKIGRWGGEEFVCVCYELDKDKLQSIAEEVREFIAEKKYDVIENMTCSVGVSNVCKEDTAKSAFERLDATLYEAKSDGRNCVRISKC